MITNCVMMQFGLFGLKAMQLIYDMLPEILYIYKPLDFLCFTVTLVKSARQVIDALNAEGQHIDIILAELDLPMKKGMKMLKYIARDKEFRRIPVISKLVFFILLRNQ